MDLNLTKLLDWSSTNHMNVNIKKTKEMIICPSNSNVFSILRVADVEIERVDVLNYWVSILIDPLSGMIMSKVYATKQPLVFIFFKQLKRSSVGPDDLFRLYATMIRP